MVADRNYTFFPQPFLVAASLQNPNRKNIDTKCF